MIPITLAVAFAGVSFVLGMTFTLSTRPWCVCPKCRREWRGPR